MGASVAGVLVQGKLEEAQRFFFLVSFGSTSLPSYHLHSRFLMLSLQQPAWLYSLHQSIQVALSAWISAAFRVLPLNRCLGASAVGFRLSLQFLRSCQASRSHWGWEDRRGSLGLPSWGFSKAMEGTVVSLEGVGAACVGTIANAATMAKRNTMERG